MVFEFDPAKSASNRLKHGLDFIQAQQVWADPDRVRLAANIVDDEHRWAMLGKIAGKHHTVIITYRGRTVRIISARPSSPKETRIYEQFKNQRP